MFRVVIAGSRSFDNYELLKQKCDYYLQDKIKAGADIYILSGTARGADKLGEQYAKERDFGIIEYPAPWDVYGKSAGYIRNKQMVEHSDAVIVFWDGKSKGTKHTIDLAKENDRKLAIIKFEKENK